MRNKRGFTLIELLVVIAIIALLMSILMPALTKAKELAMNSICMTRLKSMSYSLILYTNDNNDYYPMHWWARASDGEFYMDKGNEGIKKIVWFHILPKYLADPMIAFCPFSTKPDFTRNDEWGSTFKDAWQLPWGPNWEFWDKEGTLPEDWPFWGSGQLRTPSSSYGFNDHCSSAPYDQNVQQWQRVTRIRQPDMVPLAMDAAWYTVQPHTDPLSWPNPIKDRTSTPNDADLMNPVMLFRHRDGIHMSFNDYSMRRVGLKELWTLKWSKNFDNKRNKFVLDNAPWPDWVEDLKE